METEKRRETMPTTPSAASHDALNRAMVDLDKLVEFLDERLEMACTGHHCAVDICRINPPLPS
jgi:hypothetical protein